MRGVYGKARRVILGADPAGVAALRSGKALYEQRVFAVQWYLEKRQAFDEGRGHPGEVQRESELNVAIDALTNLGIPVEDATEAQLSYLRFKVRELDGLLARAMPAAAPPLPPFRHDDPHAWSGPPGPGPADVAPPMPAAPHMSPEQPSPTSPPLPTMPDQQPPAAPVQDFRDLSRTVKQSWEKVPERDRTLISVLGYGVAALAVGAITFKLVKG